MQNKISTLTGIIIILLFTTFMFGGVFIFQYLNQKQELKPLIENFNILTNIKNENDNYPKLENCSDILKFINDDVTENNNCKTKNDCETVYDNISNTGPCIADNPFLLINKNTDNLIKNRINLGIVAYSYENKCYGCAYQFSDNDLIKIEEKIDCVDNKCVVSDNIITQRSKIKVPKDFVALGQRNNWPVYLNNQYGFTMSYPTGWAIDDDQNYRLDGIVFCPPKDQIAGFEGGIRCRTNMDELLAPIELVNCNKLIRDSKNCEGNNVQGAKEYIFGNESDGKHYFKLVLLDLDYVDYFLNMVATFEFSK
jgi:hypothetical protein